MTTPSPAAPPPKLSGRVFALVFAVFFAAVFWGLPRLLRYWAAGH